VNNEQKQKIMLAVVAVVALGAGSWFAFLRPSSQANTQASEEKAAVRKTRKVVDTAPKRQKRAKGRKARKKAGPVVRKSRAEREEQTVVKKKRGRKSKKRVKKKNKTPMG
jgi:hypothetical protein